MKHKQDLDLSTFLNKEDMKSIVKYEHEAYCLNRLENSMSYKAFSDLLNDFYSKLPYEIAPSLQLDDQWLAKKIGFDGELMINVDTHNQDAIYVSKDKTKYVTIELKHIAVYKTPALENGSSGRSQYADENTYYNINGKSWKFRTTAKEFQDDYAILLMSNSRRKHHLIDAIILDKTEIKELLNQYIPEQYDGAKTPIAICYRHIRNKEHMVGNKAEPNYAKLLTDLAIEFNVIHRKTPKGRFFFTSNPYLKSIAETQTEVLNWFKTNQNISDPATELLLKEFKLITNKELSDIK